MAAVRHTEPISSSVQQLQQIVYGTDDDLADDDDGTQTVFEQVSEYVTQNMPVDGGPLVMNYETMPSSSMPMMNAHWEVPSLWITSTGPGKDDFHYSCLIEGCSAIIVRLEDLSRHVDAHFEQAQAAWAEIPVDSRPPIRCPVRDCHMTLQSDRYLYRHMRVHFFHADKQRVGLQAYKKLFPDLRPCGFDRSAHLDVDGEAGICGWKDCRQVFDDQTLYLEHVANHLSDVGDADREADGSYRCQWSSDGPEPFRCELRFGRLYSLKLHVQSHSGDRLGACPFCGGFFSNNTKLSDHVFRRSKDVESAPLTCALCQKKFLTSRLLKLHCRKHVKSVKCAFCSVVMDCASAIQKHMRLVHGRVKEESCPECGLAFGLRTDLQKHIDAIHAKEPKFGCIQCGKTFRWKKQLRTHVKMHADNYIPKPYLCHKCTAEYESGSSLSRHFKMDHDLPLPTGFNRFQYKKCHDGFYRLQTARCISQHVIEAPKMDFQ